MYCETIIVHVLFTFVKFLDQLNHRVIVKEYKFHVMSTCIYVGIPKFKCPLKCPFRKVTIFIKVCAHENKCFNSTLCTFLAEWIMFTGKKTSTKCTLV